MHPYSINSNERSSIQLLMAGISILLTWFIKSNFNFPWWFEDPSIVGIYGILYLFFDRYLWKYPFFYSIGIIQTPNINGVWKGYLKSSYDQFINSYEVEIKIIQNWTAIDITFKSLSSKGKSVTSTIVIEKNKDFELTYTYLNEPFANAKIPMNIHRGTSILCFTNDLNQADGEYYSGRGRVQYGEIHLSHVRA